MKPTSIEVHRDGQWGFPAAMRDQGVDADVVEACRASIDAQAAQLARLG